MTIVLLVVIAALLAVIAALIFVSRRPRGRCLVLAHLKDDSTFEGVVVHRSRDHYRLGMVKMIQSENQTVSLEGEVEIPRERVLFLQLVAREG